MILIGPTKSEDIPALESVLQETQLFPPEMLSDMVKDFLSDKESEDLWLSCKLNDEVIGFCYAAPEQLAEGTWNMLAIAVHPGRQGHGAGRAIVRKLESHLKELGHRVLITDTSSADEFGDTREFYRRNGYVEEARIRDFWAEGDDKIVFWKSLSS